MASIDTAKRLIKRIILANVTSDKKDLALTPLISGRHGIGKSQMIKRIAEEMDGECITIEGGTLKEGEITGLPYLGKDENGNTIFRFVPYYAVDRIQKEEKRLAEIYGVDENNNKIKGDENKYSRNNISKEEKIKLLLDKEIKPVIIFIDEINRTVNEVYKELMNILLTRSVNGYNFPWWVFFVGAMNPSTLNSVYATNEMDPAQLDRFIKIKVDADNDDWMNYATKNHLDYTIMDFIAQNPALLCDKRLVDDEEQPSPTPRSWDMVDSIMKSVDYLKPFFSGEENNKDRTDADLRIIINSKLGSKAGTMYFESLKNRIPPIMLLDILKDDDELSNTEKRIKELSDAKIIQSIHLILDAFREKFNIFKNDNYENNKLKLKKFYTFLTASQKLVLTKGILDIKHNGKSLFIELYDTFEKEMIKTLENNDELKQAIERNK